ncbi:hydrogenase maturation protein [Rubrobacter tropicus]|uniref:Hydrogenase maturation protein n=1 Tax=Rubrobacter tropicus TaxID=2653851 RepID=A0A6G8QAD5_9ACTN|nr:HypC/HybG/HupF family hydrogenase formation chaperone [Rubrobacter tropicus]QIN83388.1 hydrogenase maturation protein [Rubrobacter tropicus]
MENSTYTNSCTTTHEGCIVCSDAGIPLRVVSIAGDDATCEDASGNRTTVAIELVSPVSVGETLLTHGGAAIAKVGQQKLTAES